jgi:MFS family permease
MGGFALASTLCGLAVNPTMLIASRVLQAVTAAALTPQVLAIIRITFAPQERAFAIGLYGTSMGFASIVAQVVGGSLVSLDLFGWSWRPIFLINVPIGLLAIGAGARVLRESRMERRPSLDLGGVGLVSLALVLLVFPLAEGREAGWPAWSFGMLVASVPVLVGFIWYERLVARRGRPPLVALHLFRVPAIAFGLVVSTVFFSGLGVFFVVLTVFLQSGLGYSAFRAGLMFLPFAVGFSAASSVSGPIAARVGGRVLGLGMALMVVGLACVVSVAQAEPLLMVPGFLIYGLGQALAQPGMINAVVGSAGVSGEDAGSAAGLFLTVAQSSIALGVAAIGDVFFARLGDAPDAADYGAALVRALACNLVLLVAALMLVRSRHLLRPSP